MLEVVVFHLEFIVLSARFYPMEREIRDRLAEPQWVQAEPAPHWD